MLRSILISAGVFVIGLGLSVACFANPVQVDIEATIPQINGLSVTISPVDAETDIWGAPVSSVDFGTLSLDGTYQIFRASNYFAVDVGLNSNAANWQISHVPTSVIGTEASNSGYNLDDNINVDFVKQQWTEGGDYESGVLANKSFAASNVTYSKSNFATGEWLRIYYGLASGEGDNSGVNVITPDSKPYGKYAGWATLTLTAF